MNSMLNIAVQVLVDQVYLAASCMLSVWNLGVV